jgi:MFS family permease
MKLRGRAPAGATMAIVAEGFLSRLSFGFVGLALPLYALHLNMSFTQIGFLVSVNTVLQLVAKPLMAPLSDRFGHRRTLIVAIAGRSLVCLLFVFSTMAWQLFAIRMLYGLTQALRDPPLNAVIADAGGKKKVASMFSWYHTAKNVAASLGRAGAGVMLALGASMGNRGYQLVFLVAFVLSLLPLGVVVRYLRPSVRDHAPSGETTPSLGTHVGTKVWKFTLLGFLFGITAGMLNLFPAIAAEYFHLGPAEIGFIMLASALVIIVAGPVFGWLADHGSRTLVLMIRGFANITSSVMYLVFPSVWGVGASKMVDDTGKAAFRPAWGSVMAEVAAEQPHKRARVMAWIDTGEDAGDAAGPILAGWLLAVGGPHGLALMLGVRCGLAGVTEVWTWWTTHRSQPTWVPDAASDGAHDSSRLPHA